MSELTKLADKYGTDKGSYRLSMKGHLYTKTYEKYLLPLKDGMFTLLEIGVRYGNSMMMWKEYFPKASIYGLDLVPPPQKISEEHNIFIVDATEKIAIKSVIDKIGNPFVIIDDGSHKAQDIITSLYLLKGHLLRGGYYFIEDLDPNQDKEMVKTYIKGLDDMIVLEYSLSEAGNDEELVVLQRL